MLECPNIRKGYAKSSDSMQMLLFRRSVPWILLAAGYCTVCQLEWRQTFAVIRSVQWVETTPIVANKPPSEVIDPTLLQRQLATYPSFWEALEHHGSNWRHGVLYGTSSLSLDSICAAPPGEGPEQRAYPLLTEKIRIADSNSNLTLFCGMYTHSGMLDLARAAALTWGSHCDGFVGFSNVSVPEFNMMNIQHSGPESYFNMWQKTRSIWRYVYQHYSNYEFYHLGGDDLYVIVPNLKAFLKTYSSDTPFLAGQWIRQKNRPYVGGGPGYTISRAALLTFMELWDDCFPNVTASAEDRLFSTCLLSHRVQLLDTRDHLSEQRYHDVGPDGVYAPNLESRRRNFHTANLRYYASLAPVPSSASSTEPWRISTNNRTPTVGYPDGLGHASASSVSFHKIHHPTYMARLHAILYQLCPPSTPLGTAS